MPADINVLSEPQTSTETVGIIGLGSMGGPMSQHLCSALPGGVHVTARHAMDVARKVGAAGVWHDSAEDLARACSVVILMVPDMPDVREVLFKDDGLVAGFNGAAREALVVVSSTVDPQGVIALGEELRDATQGRVHLVDAPVSGGEEGAKEATLAIMVGGSDEDVSRVMPILNSLGNPVHLGPLGCGETAKACNQLIVAATVSALGEASLLAERSGMDVAAMFTLLQGGFAGSRLLTVNKDRLVNHDHHPSGAAKFMVKDLGFVQGIAEATTTATPLTDALRQVFVGLTEDGLGDENVTVVQQYLAGQARDGQ